MPQGCGVGAVPDVKALNRTDGDPQFFVPLVGSTVDMEFTDQAAQQQSVVADEGCTSMPPDGEAEPFSMANIGTALVYATNCSLMTSLVGSTFDEKFKDGAMQRQSAVADEGRTSMPTDSEVVPFLMAKTGTAFVDPTGR